jgi:hypothetical protein
MSLFAFQLGFEPLDAAKGHSGDRLSFGCPVNGDDSAV